MLLADYIKTYFTGVNKRFCERYDLDEQAVSRWKNQKKSTYVFSYPEASTGDTVTMACAKVKELDRVKGSSDPLLPRRDQFSRGPVGQTQFQAALITYQAAIIVVLRREVEALKAAARLAENSKLVEKHKRFLIENR